MDLVSSFSSNCCSQGQERTFTLKYSFTTTFYDCFIVAIYIEGLFSVSPKLSLSKCMHPWLFSWSVVREILLLLCVSFSLEQDIHPICTSPSAKCLSCKRNKISTPGTMKIIQFSWCDVLLISQIKLWGLWVQMLIKVIVVADGDAADLLFFCHTSCSNNLWRRQQGWT